MPATAKLITMTASQYCGNTSVPIVTEPARNGGGAIECGSPPQIARTASSRISVKPSVSSSEVSGSAW
jgi:hypothetical protein